MKKLMLITFISVLCSACAITTHYVQSDSKGYPSTNSEDIKVYANSKVMNNYIVIGSLATLVPGNGDQAVKELKKEAAKIGADAIIALELDKINSIANSTQALGVAVKFR